MSVCSNTHLDALCVQLHKCVFCFRCATNKALKRIQSTYLNNCLHTHKYVIAHTCYSATKPPLLLAACAPVQSFLLSLFHSREQMFGDSLQPQRISVYSANSSTQHFELQREICSQGFGGGIVRRGGAFESVEGAVRTG